MSRWISLGIVFGVACASSSPVVRPPPKPVLAPLRTYVLLERVPGAKGPHAMVRPLASDHPRRTELETILARPYLQWVLALGDEVKRQAKTRCAGVAECERRFDQPAYFLIEEGGNRPKQGLQIGEVAAPEAWYVEVDPDDASTLIPHEYGHVLMFMSLPGDLPQDPQLLPHTTGAITNDVVAFSEGWGIHFETLAGDRREDTRAYSAFHRDGFAIDGELVKGDSFVPIKDLFNYAQTYRRYSCVKDNCFAFLPRTLARSTPTPAEIVARWTDTTFDPANVRSLEQMVASEGLIATLFYRLGTAPTPSGPSGIAGDPALPDPARYAAMFEAFARVTHERASATPCVLVFLEALLERANPTERARIARIAMEVFHYTLAVRDAPKLYAEFHAMGHRIDKDAFQKRLAATTGELQATVRQLAEKPAMLREVAAPELWVKTDRVLLELPRLGISKRPLVFDLNAAPIELLMTLPDVGYTEAIAIDDARRARGFRDLDDLATVSGVRATTVNAVRAMSAATSTVR